MLALEQLGYCWFFCFHQSGDINLQGICQCLHSVKPWPKVLLTRPQLTKCRTRGLGPLLDGQDLLRD